MLIYKVRYNTHICVHHTLFQVFSLLSYPLGAAIIFLLFSGLSSTPVLLLQASKCCFILSNPVHVHTPFLRSAVLYTQRAQRIYVVETVYIIHFQTTLHSHYEQIMQIFHPRHPVLMYLSSPRQVYSTKKLRSRNRHFSRYFHDSTNRSKVALIFTGDSILNRTLAE